MGGCVLSAIGTDIALWHWKLHLLADATDDDIAWGRALARLRLDHPAHTTAVTNPRTLLQQRHGSAVADVAATSCNHTLAPPGRATGPRTAARPSPSVFFR